MSGGFRVSTEGLDAIGERLRAESRQILATLEALDDQAARLRGNWSGAAQAAYDQAHAQWVVAADDINQVLGRIASAAQSIAGSYTETDRHAAGYFTTGA